MQTADLKSAWRADFRSTSKLPDTKVVRTSFYYNIAASLLLAASSYYMIQTELSLSDKKAEIASTTAEIEKNSASNAEAVKNNTAYKTVKSTVDDLDSFLAPQSMSSIDFIREITASLPSQVLVETIEQKQNSAKITAHAKGQAEEATRVAHTLEQQLNKNTIITKFYSKIAIGNVVHDSLNSRMNFEITMSSTPAKPAAKK